MLRLEKAKPAQPSHPPRYRPFDGKFFHPTCPTQCLLPVGPSQPRSCKAESRKADRARRRGQKPGWLSRDRPDLHAILSVFDRGHFVRNGARMTTTTTKTKKMETAMNVEK